MTYTPGFASTIRAGYEKPHHTATHEEPLDGKLGYQLNSSWFTRNAMRDWAQFVTAFQQVKEGDGTLLDNLFIYATTDHGYARTHSLDGIPVFTAGRAGGRVKTGIHVDAKATASTRVGYTALRLMGVDVQSWGTNSNNTTDPISEILA